MTDLLPVAIIGGSIALSTGTTIAVTSGSAIGNWHWRKHGCKQYRVLLENLKQYAGNILKKLAKMVEKKKIQCSATYAVSGVSGCVLDVPFSKFWLKTPSGTNVAVFPVTSGGYLVGYDFWSCIWFGTTYRQERAYTNMNQYLRKDFFQNKHQ